MAATRSSRKSESASGGGDGAEKKQEEPQQQKLQVDKEANELKHSTGEEEKEKQNGDEKKRKQGDDDGKGNEHEDKGANGDTSENGQPPSKAAKTEDDDGKGAATQPTEPSGEAKQVETKLSGKDTGAAGSNQDDVKWEVLERGHIFFYYRPKVQSAKASEADEPAAQSIDDTQNFHLLLLPRQSDSATAPAKPEEKRDQDSENKSQQTGELARAAGVGARMIRLGKKRLPEPKAALKQGDQPGGIGGDSSEAIWAVVSDVSPSFDNLKDSLAERHYTTKTAGERVVQGARPVGRGWYVVTVSQTEPPSSREVRLSYALSHPHAESDFGDVQKELGLNLKSSIRLQMRNPTLPSTGAGAPPAGLDPSARAELSKAELDETFGGSSDEGTNYARPENLDLLDRAGVELLMIKKKEQEAEGDLGMGDTHEKAIEKLAAADAKKLSTGDVLKELDLDSKENPPNALDGEWI